MGPVIQQRQGEIDDERACDREIKKGRKGKEINKCQDTERQMKTQKDIPRHTQTK